MPGEGSHTRQMLLSLAVALLIVAVAIIVVTARLGPTSAAEQDALEERQEERLDQLEELQEERQERREDSSGRDGG
jgi:uncharacterized membrane-anchored protein YhcB (DUF1043 family)